MEIYRHYRGLDLQDWATLRAALSLLFESVTQARDTDVRWDSNQ